MPYSASVVEECACLAAAFGCDFFALADCEAELSCSCSRCSYCTLFRRAMFKEVDSQYGCGSFDTEVIRWIAVRSSPFLVNLPTEVVVACGQRLASILVAGLPGLSSALRRARQEEILGIVDEFTEKLLSPLRDLSAYVNGGS